MLDDEEQEEERVPVDRSCVGSEDATSGSVIAEDKIKKKAEKEEEVKKKYGRNKEMTR